MARATRWISTRSASGWRFVSTTGAPVRDEVFVGVADRPDDGLAVRERDRAVPILERGIRLRRDECRLAELQRCLVRQPDRPAAAQEHERARGLGALRQVAP